MEFTPKYNATIDNMPQLPYAIEEAVNRLRVNLSFQGSKVRKIMVVSTVPDEGKSFVSMQLWRQMAEADVKSVLLDMDLRKSVMIDKYQITQEDKKKSLEPPFIWRMKSIWMSACCIQISEKAISCRIPTT